MLSISNYVLPPQKCLGLVVVPLVDYLGLAKVLPAYQTISPGYTVSRTVSAWTWGVGGGARQNLEGRLWLAVEYDCSLPVSPKGLVRVAGCKVVATSTDPHVIANFLWQFAPENIRDTIRHLRKEVTDGRIGTVGHYGIIHGGIRSIVEAGKNGFASTGDGGRAIVGDGGHAKAGWNAYAQAGKGGTAEVGSSSGARAGKGGKAIAGAFGKAMAGDGGSASAGNFGEAYAGKGGTAIVGQNGIAEAGDGGTAMAGDEGSAHVSGAGSASAGAKGLASAGAGGKVKAGEGGMLMLEDGDWGNHLAYVGEFGILPDTFYVLNEKSEFVLWQ